MERGKGLATVSWGDVSKKSGKKKVTVTGFK